MVRHIQKKLKIVWELKKKVKYPNGVGIYDLENNLIKSFDYASDLAIYLDKSKVTVSKYINKGLVFEDKYYLKVNPFKE